MSDLISRLRTGVYGTNHIPLCEEAAAALEKAPQALWDAFIKRLEESQPLGMGPHQSFMGSIAGYKKIFMEANDS